MLNLYYDKELEGRLVINATIDKTGLTMCVHLASICLCACVLPFSTSVSRSLDTDFALSGIFEKYIPFFELHNYCRFVKCKRDINYLGATIVWELRHVGLTSLLEYRNQVPKKGYKLLGEKNSLGVKVGWVNKSVRISKTRSSKRDIHYLGGVFGS